VIRIRPGQSWRLNPGYVDELRALSAPGARQFDGGGILDALGIEVDGVDIAAGVGEAEVLVAVDELLGAIRRLGQGAIATQATVGRGPTELVLEARGHDVLLSLVTLAPPARLLASGLLLDGGRLWTAAATAGRGLAADLLRISPTLEQSPLLHRLRTSPRQPARRASQPWPRAEGRAFLARSGRGAVRCEVQVPAPAAARLAERSEVPDAPLAPLIGAGAVALRFTGAPALQWEGPVYLALRNLVREAEALVRAWEAGEPAFQLRFASVDLACDLTRDEIRAPGWRAPASVAPVSLALSLAGAARAYAEKAQRLSGRRVEGDDPLRDLRASAARLARHCAELASGELRRAPEIVAAPPPALPARTPQPPLSRGRIRRLVYRQGWRIAAEERPGAIWPCAGALVTVGLHQVVGRDAASGRTLFEEPCRFAVRAQGSDDLFVSGAESLARIDPLTGAARWRRRTTSAAELWAVPGGVVRASPSGLERFSDAGTQSWRSRLPGGAPTDVLYSEGVLACAGRGVLAALDAQDGRLLWKRRARVLALAGTPGRLVALCGAARPANQLVAVDPFSGKVLWERPLPDGSESTLCTWADSALVVSGERRREVTFARLADGTRRFSTALPFAGHARIAADEQALVATGPGGSAARIDERGRIAWQLEPEGDAPAERALLQRGVLLLRRGGVLLCEAASGHELARIATEPPKLAALAEDMSVALLDEDDALSLNRLASHFSVV
jgi:PQQ-like domain